MMVSAILLCFVLGLAVGVLGTVFDWPFWFTALVGFLVGYEVPQFLL